MKIWIVDAFTTTPFKGNPAGVCIVEDYPTTYIMQNIASELNLSETAFVKPLKDNGYSIRWFTPNSEAPLCGHATLASTHILIENNFQQEGDKISFESLAGELIVTKSNNLINLEFPHYPVHTIEYTDQLQKIVHTNPIYTGFAHNCIFMEFSSPEEVINLQPDLKLLTQYECRALIATSTHTQYDFISRYFAPRVGIDEDPVCASAHCRLIPYWSKKLNKDEMIAYQASARGGVIMCKDLGNKVVISGHAVTILEGYLQKTLFEGMDHVK